MVTPPRAYQVDRLGDRDKIINENGTATTHFIQQWNLMQALVRQVATLSGIDIATLAPILGGGPLTALEPISHDVSGVTPGTYGDATNVPQITIDEFGHITLAADVPISGGSGGPFAGATASGAGNASVTAFATKGTVFTPSVDMTVDYLWGYVDAASAGQAHRAEIAPVNTAAAGVIAAAPAVSSNVSSLTTNMERMRFNFATPVQLTAGTPYLLAVVLTTGTGTTALRLQDIAQAGNTQWDLNCPGEFSWNSHDYNTIGLSNGQSPSASSATVKHGVALEGTL